MVYVLEEVAGSGLGGGSGDERIGPDRAFAAMTQTEVCDGFWVRHTSGLDDTCQFLAALTGSVRRKLASYKTVRVHGVHTDNRREFWEAFEQEKVTTIEDKERLLVAPYETFSAIMAKSANQTTEELFLKQLMAIHGMSLERALLIWQAFPTPRSLHHHFAGLGSDAERKHALQALPKDGTRGATLAIGPKLAEMLFYAFCK